MGGNFIKREMGGNFIKKEMGNGKWEVTFFTLPLLGVIFCNKTLTKEKIGFL